MKHILISLGIFFFIFLLNSCNDSNSKSAHIIEGNVVEPLSNKDSIFFFSGSLKDSYYEIPTLASGIINKEFKLNGELTYPHLYWIKLKSERNKIPQRGGYYFIDPTTSTIKVDPIGECSSVKGKAHREFTSQFLPFLFEDYGCNSYELGKLEFNNGSKFNEQLHDYIKVNQDSYVALWLLINRIDNEGYDTIFETSLLSFSDELKNTRLWKMANEEVQNFRIREGEKFPTLELQTVDLIEANLQLPEAKFTLIDFWFSFCIPCLKEFPALKELYSKYNSRGFELVGISVDKSNSVEKWKVAIEKHELPWVNYLDENGIESSKEKITSFPTTFLLDESGRVIRKNISTEDLALFLEAELTK